MQLKPSVRPAVAVDRTETIAQRHLISRGFTDIVFEPDGNVPPDFLVDGHIAIEVRRLNQNWTGASGYEGLEQVIFPLRSLFERVLPSLGPPDAAESWFVIYTFRRPLPPWKQLEAVIRGALVGLSGGALAQARKLQVLPNLRLEVIRASKVHATKFLLGGFMDRDSGGFVVSEMDRNIKICVGEKTGKVAPVRSKYPHWWLVLIDHVAHSLSAQDHEHLRAILGEQSEWDKLIIVNPENPTQGFDL